MKNVNKMNAGEFRKMLFEAEEKKQMEDNAKKKKEDEAKKNDQKKYDELQDKKHEACKKEQAFGEFKRNVRKSLLAECVLKLYNGGIGERIEYANEDTIKRGLVNKFIEENGTEAIINSFRTKSYVLSEFARNINEFSKLICEKAKKDDDATIDADLLGDFNTCIDTDDVDDLCTSIKMRVSNALSEFNANNMQERQEIKDTLRISQDKIDSARTNALKESYEIDAKRKVADIRSRKKNIIGAMVYNIAESSMKNEKIGKVFKEESKLNVGSIVERVELLYTFLETLNTSKIEKIDEEYLLDTLKGLKA